MFNCQLSVLFARIWINIPLQLIDASSISKVYPWITICLILKVRLWKAIPNQIYFFWYSLIAVKKDGWYQRSNQVPTDMTCKFELHFPLVQLSFSWQFFPLWRHLEEINELWYMLVPTLSWMSKVNVLIQFEKWNSCRLCYGKSVNMIINSVDIYLISHIMTWLFNVIMTSFLMSHSYHERDNVKCELLMLLSSAISRKHERLASLAIFKL